MDASAPKDPASSTGSLREPFRKLGWRFWITFLIACAIAEGGEFLLDKLREPGRDYSGFADSVITATGLYQRIVSAPRNPLVHFTVVVEINPNQDLPAVSASNVCPERAFLAELLTKIDSFSPAEIVIDKYFGRDSCSADDPGTVALRQTIATIRQHEPVLVGLRARDVEAGVRHGSVIDPSLEFDQANPGAQTAIVNIAYDNRTLPLQWQLYESPQSLSAGKSIVLDTVSLAAAKLYDPHLLRKNPRLQQLIDSGAQPFIGFLDIGKFAFAHYYAGQVLCGASVPDQLDWRTCDRHKGTSPAADLRGKIFLIGETDSDRDQHYSVVGRVAGFYLQANYVEALLDDRVYTSAGDIVNYGFAFAFLVALELILVIFEHNPVRAVAMIGGLILAGAGLLYLIILHLKVYIDPFPVGITAVLIKILHLVYSYVRREPPPAAQLTHQ